MDSKDTERILIQSLASDTRKRLIEDGFPFAALSEIAEAESWRKEIYRPIYYIHKWWARRLGTVFRAVIIGSAISDDTSLMNIFYKHIEIPDLVIFDPFMGSGTTVGEAIKLGCKVIGRDINPVAYFMVESAFQSISPDDLQKQYMTVDEKVSSDILQYYQSIDSSGRDCEVLYYFWVKTLQCPSCSINVDLFSSRIFAKNAYPKKHPEAKSVCPKCGEINEIRYDDKNVCCQDCGTKYNPKKGAARKSKALCPDCNLEFPIAETYRESRKPPTQRMYAKLVLTSDGNKEYLKTTDFDYALYSHAEKQLATMKNPFPIVKIRDGYNTRQVIRYGYSYWHEMFNSRQLLTLSLLGKTISDLSNGSSKNLLACLFSGVLEFNNMFASYKGEGTGAVRHMFSHHILKPERMPLEANPWGTPKSSGSFSTLFKSRILRAIDYRMNPFEVSIRKENGKTRGLKVFGISSPMNAQIHLKYPKGEFKPGDLYLSCGDSAHTDIPTGSVDYVITDPPFFDNVHYSELADFFYVWLNHFFNLNSHDKKETTRHPSEVQSPDVNQFIANLCDVFRECHRVLKDDGFLIFSYHHSREEGWTSIAKAILDSGFYLVQAQPIKSEMSVATPKSQTKNPIDLDVILVCRKSSVNDSKEYDDSSAIKHAKDATRKQIQQFNEYGRYLSLNDTKVVYMSQLLRHLSKGRKSYDVVSILDSNLNYIENIIELLCSDQP